MRHDREKEQLEDEVYLNERIEEERERNAELFAIKLVERIVFGLVGLILTAVVTALVVLVLK